MASAVEVAVDTYIRVSNERDPAVRATLLDACLADDVRLVTRTRVIRGRAAFAAMFDRFFADAGNLRVVPKAIDAQGRTFRFRAVVERRDGTHGEVFDAGEIDDDGRITTILTFAGPLEP